MSAKYKHNRFGKAINELSSYNVAKRKIVELQNQRKELIEELSSIKAIDYSKIVVQGGKSVNYAEDLHQAIEKVTKRIVQEITKNEEKLASINERLDRIGLFEGQVLHYYFIEMKNIEQISRLMSWSDITIKRYKQSGLQQYTNIMEEENG